MYLATHSKHPHVNYNQLMTRVYKIHCMINLRSKTRASLFESTLSGLIDPMTRDNLNTNIIPHDRNLIIMFSSRFLLCFVMYHGLH